MFNSAYPILSSLGIQSIGIDTPGYGQSDSPDHQPKILDYAECVIDVIESLNLEKAFSKFRDSITSMTHSA